MPISTGSRVGVYDVLGRLGAGAMGEVYRARDTRLGRDVALKVLPAGLAADAERLSRLEREARVLASLNHPRIAAVYGLEESGAERALAMELVEGDTLEDRLARGSLTPAEVMAIARQITDAVAYAHSRGVIHRDLKPANIKVSRNGDVKVLDFGLAKRLPGPALSDETQTSEQDVTQPGTIAGTLAYMSPEQLRGASPDQRTDVWSLGVVLFEMISRRRPFEGRSTFELTSAILRDAPAAAETGILAVVVERCLQKDPEQRYQSAGELLEALGAPPAQLPKQRRLLWPAAAAVLAVAAGATGIWLWRSAEAPDAGQIRTLAVLPLRSLTGDADNHLGMGIADTLITRVSQTGGLTVRPMSAVRRYAQQDIDAISAARDLKVDAVLDGTVQRANDRLRISVNLMRASTGQSIWAQSFDLQFTDIFTMQDQVALEAVSRMHVKLNEAQKAKLERRDTSSAEAYEYYVRGVQDLDRRGIGSASRPVLTSAITMFEQAIAKDPNYALAHAQLAYAQTWIGLFVEPAKGVEWVQRARSTLARARALKADLAEIHLVEHEIYWSTHGGWRLDSALRELKEAKRINPSVGDAQMSSLYSHVGMGEEAIAAARRALEIDHTSENTRALAVEMYLNLGRYHEAQDERKRLFGSAELPPRLVFMPQLDSDDGVAAGRAMVDRYPNDARIRSRYALDLARTGRFAEAEAEVPAILRDAESNRGYHHMAFNLASVCALRGDAKNAVEWLRKSASTGMPNYPLFARDPALDRVRTAPEFIAFIGDLKRQWEQLTARLRTEH